MSKKSCLIIIVISLILLIILFACGAICYLLSESLSNYDVESLNTNEVNTLTEGGQDKIAVINVEGIIMDTDTSSDIWGSTYASSRKIIEDLDKALSDDEVKAVIININSPGGDVYASDIIYNKIQEVQEQGLIVIALMRNTAASGGYYIVASADRIVASPLTLTGSIGVRMDVQSLAGLYEKLGIETRTITNSNGEFKTGEGLFDDDPNGEEDKIYQRLIDEYFDRFVSIVAEGRKKEKDEVLEIADGRVFSGKQAYEVGLIDVLGGYDEAVEEAEKLTNIENATIIEYKEYSFWNMFAGYVSNLVNPTAQVTKLVDPTPGVKFKYLYMEE